MICQRSSQAWEALLAMLRTKSADCVTGGLAPQCWVKCQGTARNDPICAAGLDQFQKALPADESCEFRSVGIYEMQRRESSQGLAGASSSRLSPAYSEVVVQARRTRHGTRHCPSLRFLGYEKPTPIVPLELHMLRNNWWAVPILNGRRKGGEKPWKNLPEKKSSKN